MYLYNAIAIHRILGRAKGNSTQVEHHAAFLFLTFLHCELDRATIWKLYSYDWFDVFVFMDISHP